MAFNERLGLGNLELSQGIGEARDIGGSTGIESANQFVTIRTAGVRDLVAELRRRAGSATAPILKKIVKRAAMPIEKKYAELARNHTATGNLAASVTHEIKAYADGGVIAVVGPRQTGSVGSTDDARSGNHAWLVEFGTSRRKPGSQGRRAYINVHQAINGKMSRKGSFNNSQFEAMGRGYYFLMGSINEPSRQGSGRAGYSRDFMLGKDGRSGKQHPITLRPGETIAPMKPLKLMQKTIDGTAGQVLEALKAGLERELMKT